MLTIFNIIDFEYCCLIEGLVEFNLKKYILRYVTELKKLLQECFYHFLKYSFIVEISAVKSHKSVQHNIFTLFAIALKLFIKLWV